MKSTFLPLIAILATSIALMLPQYAWPQKPEMMRRIGILYIGRPAAPDAPRPAPTAAGRAFAESLAKHGYVEGKNLSIERRVGEYEHLPALARELERLKVEVIWVLAHL